MKKITVIRVGIDPDRISRLHDGKSPIFEPGMETSLQRNPGSPGADSIKNPDADIDVVSNSEFLREGRVVQDFFIPTAW